ncbi:MAG TPA: divalent-cation tolerance protein CutA [Thermoanaerobaculia bacterium]|nr:divalent-cation tolerance protein CutA [Thermoanaerobaculia bacterium]
MLTRRQHLLDRSPGKEWNLAVRGKDLIVVVTSVGTEEQARDIAHAIVRGRHAACVNLIPNVHSIYRWKGRVCEDGEYLLLIKTRASHFAAVQEKIQKINTYELPEVLAYRVDDASPAFARWIQQMTERPKRRVRLREVPRRRAAAR